VSENPDQKLIDALQVMREQQQIIITAYESQPSKAKKGAALAEWWCPAGDRLLFVWKSPMGTLFYQKRYKLSPGMNEKLSNEAGRKKNTFDGVNHWLPRAGNLDHLREWGDQAGLRLTCGHRMVHVRVPELFDVIDNAVPGRPTKVFV